MSSGSGTLFIVATPMGNLEDMTFRAVRTLKEADLIAAEDTRHSRKLLTHYGIGTPVVSCHEHNEAKKSQVLIAKLLAGHTIALISDAGTPLISDPGFRLVQAAADQGIQIIPIPGCNAAVAGLSGAGLPTDSFLFCGFPPRKPKARAQFLTDLQDQSPTLIFYESPKRILALIQTAIDIFQDRKACLARELTKRHEEFIRGSLSEILSSLEPREKILGEMVLLIEGAAQAPCEITRDELENLIRSRLCESVKTSQLAKEIATSCHLPRKQVYETILALKNRSE